MSAHRRDSKPADIQDVRLIVTYSEGGAEKRIVWGPGERLVFPAPYYCYAERNGQKIRFLRSSTVPTDDTPVEVCSVPVQLACVDGAAARIPVVGAPINERKRVHYINIRPEVQLAFTGRFRYKKSRDHGSKHPQAAKLAERPVVVANSAPKPKPKPKLKPNSKANLKHAIPKLGMPKHAIPKQARTRSVLKELWRLSNYAALGALINFTFFDRVPTSSRINSMLGRPAAIEVQSIPSPKPVEVKSSFTKRSARDLSVAIRNARPKAQPSATRNSRKIASLKNK